jgi:hypothetical protein
MEIPPCADGTYEHAWVPQSVTGTTVVSQCMVCGVKELIRWEGDKETVRYGRRPRWGFKGLPPDDARPSMLPQAHPAAIVDHPLDDISLRRARRREQ